MGNILSRIQEIACKEGITIGAFERSIGASKGVLSRAITNGTDIQSKWIGIIVENYPLYSTRWLLTGEGPMLRDSKTSEESKLGCTPNTTPISSAEESIIYKMYEKKDEENKALTRENGRLEERIHSLEAKLQEYEASPPPVAHKEIREVLGSLETAKDAPIRKHTPGSERFSGRTNLQTEK